MISFCCRASLIGIGLLAALGLTPVSAHDPIPPTDCASLVQADFLQIPQAPTRILSAERIEGESAPPYCEVRGTIETQVNFAVRMPERGWNGKLLFQGCGGFCGGVWIDNANDALARGYATATTDMGHSSTPYEAEWAYNNRALKIDFGWRATHVSTEAAKAISQAYYTARPRLTYFRGCSTGGRQGLVAAQRFPEDYDAMIVGAPVINYGRGTGLQLLWSVRSLMEDRTSAVLGKPEIEFLHDRVMKSCDAVDGVTDGIIGDPGQCTFEVASLQCSPDDSEAKMCLSPVQVDAVKRVYSGPVKSDGTPVFVGGPELGSELNWIGPYVTEDRKPGSYLAFMSELFRYLVLTPDPGPDWDPMSFDFDRDYRLLDMMEPLYNGTNPDLRRFRANGGKLIQFHGWNDQSVVPKVSTDYYETTTHTMGGAKATQEFYRLFMVPGLNHCAGGVGATGVDYLSALENWRENGVAPAKLIATGARPDGAPFSRPLFPFPLVARYRGDGSTDEASSFEAARSYRR